MKILYVTPFFRFPPDFGLGIRNYHILECLTERHTVLTVSYGPDSTGKTDQWLAGRGSSCSRLSYAFPRTVSNNRWTTVRRMFYYPTASFQRFAPTTLARRLNDLLQQHPDVDLILFDTQLVGQTLLYQAFNQPCILVMADVYEAWFRRQVMVTGWRPFAAVYLADWLKTALYERRILSRYRYIVTVSANDYDIVAGRDGQSEVTLFPNGVDTAYFAPVSPQTNKEDVLLFVGAFGYGPNVDAFLYFCREIFPLLRARRPQIKFMAVGRDPSPDMKALAEREPGITVIGAVPDVRPYYAQASLAVIPLRLGSGLKLKTLEAFAMEVPVVSTSVGCEGIVAQDGQHLLVASTPETFADKVIWLLEHPDQAYFMARRARQLVEEQYDWQAITKSFEAYLLRIVGTKEGQG